ncbi:MAG: hypothetical protein ACRELD_04885 [Longimicrobiales bacterium]
MTDHRRNDDARDENPGAGEQTGEAVGGIGGTLAGAAVGSAAGPVGTVIGGIAGALGGWWAGEKAGRALEDWSDEDEEYYRSHWRSDSRPDRPDAYEQARVGYMVGHVASRNPTYRERDWNQVEGDIRRGWRGVDYDYDVMRPYVRHGFERGAGRRAE